MNAKATDNGFFKSLVDEKFWDKIPITYSFIERVKPVTTLIVANKSSFYNTKHYPRLMCNKHISRIFKLKRE